MHATLQQTIISVSSPVALRPRHLTLSKAVVIRVQPPQRHPTIIREIRLAVRRQCSLEEPRFPRFLARLSRFGFFALPLFEVLFDFCGLLVLLAFYGNGDLFPESRGLVGERWVTGGYYFGEGQERL